MLEKIKRNLSNANYELNEGPGDEENELERRRKSKQCNTSGQKEDIASDAARTANVTHSSAQRQG